MPGESLGFERHEEEKEEFRRGHWSGCLAHLTALDAVGAALAALFANEATAEGGQAVEEIDELARGLR